MVVLVAIPGGVATGAPNAVTVFASGLNNPRGLTFGPDGNLYVAEGGAGGLLTSTGLCPQVIPPVGPYSDAFTALISKISPAGVRTTVVDGLPSSQTSAALGSLGTFPTVKGSEHVWKITPSGQIKTWASGLTTVLGLAFDHRDRLYVLETSAITGGPAHDRRRRAYRPERLADDDCLRAVLPHGNHRRPDGALYVSNIGFGPPPVGLGQVLRIAVQN